MAPAADVVYVLSMAAGLKPFDPDFISDMVRGILKDVSKSHPGSVDLRFASSVAKRISKQVYKEARRRGLPHPHTKNFIEVRGHELASFYIEFDTRPLCQSIKDGVRGETGTPVAERCSFSTLQEASDALQRVLQAHPGKHAVVREGLCPALLSRIPARCAP